MTTWDRPVKTPLPAPAPAPAPAGNCRENESNKALNNYFHFILSSFIGSIYQIGRPESNISYIFEIKILFRRPTSNFSQNQGFIPRTINMIDTEEKFLVAIKAAGLGLIPNNISHDLLRRLKIDRTFYYWFQRVNSNMSYQVNNKLFCR